MSNQIPGQINSGRSNSGRSNSGRSNSSHSKSKSKKETKKHNHNSRNNVNEKKKLEELSERTIIESIGNKIRSFRKKLLPSDEKKHKIHPNKENKSKTSRRQAF